VVADEVVVEAVGEAFVVGVVVEATSAAAANMEVAASLEEEETTEVEEI
jgi:hypothetical protein